MLSSRVTGEFGAPVSLASTVLLPRLEPPPQPARLIERPRIDGLLAAVADYPVTLVTAPAGGGKTVALTGFARHGGWPVAWCRLDAADTPISLALHLATAFRPITGFDPSRFVSMHPVDVLDRLINALTALGDETLLVLDDVHCADRRPELRVLIEHLIDRLPPRLHLVLASREMPSLAPLPTVAARGELYRLNRAQLAFTNEEAREFFAACGLPPSPYDDELNTLARGWPLALRFFATARVDLGATQHEPILPERLLEHIAPQLDAYLAREVLGDLPFDLRTWLLGTALMRWIDESACAAVAELADLHIDLKMIERHELFIETLPDGRSVYQPLQAASFARLAERELPNWRSIHAQLGQYYATKGDDHGAAHHFLAAAQWEEASAALSRMALAGVSGAQAVALLSWIEQIPTDHRNNAALLEARAIAERRLGRYAQALESYRQAEDRYRAQGDMDGQVRALRGQAEVYIDTVQPAPAAVLLKRAMKLLPRHRRAERATILSLQAENWINRGRADVAIFIIAAAHREAYGRTSHGDPGSSGPRRSAVLSPRLLLRSGRLVEARRLLEEELGLDTGRARGEHMLHRDPLLLLALIECMLGNGVRALALAQRGLLEAQRGDSPLTEAIAHMRLGHAYLVTASSDEMAYRHYRIALDMIESSGIPRMRAEVMMGLTLLEGHAGNLAAAEAYAREGLDRTLEAGDDWMAALIWLALGSVAATAGDPRAAQWLHEAQQRFVRGDDQYGQTVALIWEAHILLQSGKEAEADRTLARLLGLIDACGFDGVLTTRTLFGPHDLAVLVPLLLRGRALRGAASAQAAVAQRLLRQGFPSIAADDAVDTYHPGYTLRVYMLGRFRIFRGSHEIQAREWQREKARQLLQLLLTYRGMWLQREQICAWLWPDSEPSAAERQFKVTLNALNNVLEPRRPPRVAPFFIRRQGLAYSFAPSYGCWIDVDEFELRTAGAPGRDPEVEIRSRRTAFQLYRGDYLAEALYDPWTLEERERLLARHLASTATLARLLIDRGEFDEAIDLCEHIIRRDRGYEEAYQMLMRAYARSGSRSQALRAYARCVQAMQDELGMEPLPETTELCERIKRNEPV